MFSSVGAYGRSWGGGGGSWRVGQPHDVVWTEDAVDVLYFLYCIENLFKNTVESSVIHCYI